MGASRSSGGTVDDAMDAADDAPAPQPRRRLALVASGIVVVVLLALVVGSFLTGDDGDGDGLPTIDDTTAAVPTRYGDPDVEAMLATGLVAVDGSPTTLRDLITDRPVLVNQWSKTCTPCIEEMPWLDAISRANPQVEVVGINNLDGEGDARSMADQTGITYGWVRDPAGDFAHAARTVGLPDTMLFSADGNLLASKVGVFADQAAIQAFLDQHLAGGP